MSDKTNTSDEACAVACMLVSNPQGAVRGYGWQRRVNYLIRALRDERNGYRDALSDIATDNGERGDDAYARSIRMQDRAIAALPE